MTPRSAAEAAAEYPPSYGRIHDDRRRSHGLPALGFARGDDQYLVSGGDFIRGSHAENPDDHLIIRVFCPTLKPDGQIANISVGLSSPATSAERRLLHEEKSQQTTTLQGKFAVNSPISRGNGSSQTQVNFLLSSNFIVRRSHGEGTMQSGGPLSVGNYRWVFNEC